MRWGFLVLLVTQAISVSLSISNEIWTEIQKVQAESSSNSTVEEHQGKPEPTDKDFTWKLRTEAPTDECYCKMLANHDGQCSTRDEFFGCQDKSNEAYAWGMTRTSGKVFWGTLANAFCLILDTSISIEGVVCEGSGRDRRAPSVYMYSEADQTTVNLASSLQGIHFTRLNATLGLRAAGSRNGVVVMAGPSKSFTSVFMFAFDIAGKFLDSVEYKGFNDVRKFSIDPKYSMFVGLSTTNNMGHVFKYTGSTSNPLSFELVGIVPGAPAEVSFYNDRLLLATWPVGGDFKTSNIKTPAALIISPVPAMQLQYNASVNVTWPVVWSISDYEPDCVTALSYGVSVNAELDGWVYWGTMQTPYGGVALFEEVYGLPSGPVDLMLRTLGTHRATTLFRGRNLLSSNPTIELLYGESSLPVYTPATKDWSMQPNEKHEQPKFGSSGFGYFFNLYTWSMTTVGDSLLIGTFDNSYGQTTLSLAESYAYASPRFVAVQAAARKSVEEFEGRMRKRNGSTFGGDLFVITASGKGDGETSPAQWVSLNGLGNKLNIGIRNIVSDPNNVKKNVFIGTANPYNLEENGGWELYELTCPSA